MDAEEQRHESRRQYKRNKLNAVNVEDQTGAQEVPEQSYRKKEAERFFPFIRCSSRKTDSSFMLKQHHIFIINTYMDTIHDDCVHLLSNKD